MATGKKWMGGNPGSWENPGSKQLYRETLSPYIELRKETITHPTALTHQPQKTQLKHHTGLLLSIPGKPWASCNLNPGRWGKNLLFQLQSHCSLYTLSYLSWSQVWIHYRIEVKMSFSLQWSANTPYPHSQTCSFERKDYDSINTGPCKHLFTHEYFNNQLFAKLSYFSQILSLTWF